MSSLAQVPAPAHVQAESMLSRQFGKETVNYFSSICPMYSVAGYQSLMPQARP
jgi:hypothetical protein